MRALLLAVFVAACGGGDALPATQAAPTPSRADAEPAAAAPPAPTPTDAGRAAAAPAPADAAAPTKPARRQGRRAGQVCKVLGDPFGGHDRVWPCAKGLTCCYPCGIQGCAWVCKDVGTDGCPLYP